MELSVTPISNCKLIQILNNLQNSTSSLVKTLNRMKTVCKYIGLLCLGLCMILTMGYVYLKVLPVIQEYKESIRK